MEKSIVSLVLEKPIGDTPEGSVIQVEDSVAESLTASGLCREATSEDIISGNDEVDDDKDEEDGDTGAPEQMALNFNDAVLKATEAAVEKLNKQFARPIPPPQRHIAGSDERLTGGFKSLGDAVQNYIRKSQGDHVAARKFQRWGTLVEKGYMSISGSSGHAGGDLVPQQWASELFKLAFDSVPNLSALCSRQEMQYQTMNLPAWNQTSASAGVQANVIAEGSTITATQGVTANVQLTLQKGAILINLSDELLRFNGYAVDSVIKQIAPERLRYLVNDSIVNGTSSGMNLVGNAATITQVAEVPGHISYNDCLGMYSKLFDPFVAGACWLITQSTVPELYALGYPNRAATTQFPAFTPGSFTGDGQLLGAKPIGDLLGLPVYRVENVPALGSRGALILWHPKSCAFGESNMVADYTNALYFNLAQDSMRFLYYFNSVNRLTTPYTRKDNSEASNIVILSAGSTSSS